MAFKRHSGSARVYTQGQTLLRRLEIAPMEEFGSVGSAPKKKAKPKKKPKNLVFRSLTYKHGGGGSGPMSYK